MKQKEHRKSGAKQAKAQAAAGSDGGRRGAGSRRTSSQLILMLLGLCLVLGTICYLPALNGEFVNWDDPDYASNNELMRGFGHVKQLITTPVQGNHHPLTMLSLALNYTISGDDPTSYHVLNLILHLANSILVFFFIWRLSDRSLIMSYTAALLFAVHPMHVESVAWVTERKDVLYGFFFLLGLISYVRYVDEKSTIWLGISSLCCALSLASKPAAVVFPLAALSIDVIRRRSLKLSLLLEKIPMFLMAGFIAYLTLQAQSTVGATDTAGAFSLGQRIFFAFYGFMMYVVKLVAPIRLSVFYPLPPFLETLPTIYYLAPLFFIAVAVSCWLARSKTPIIVWGWAFYLISLLLVLQVKIVGGAIIADRYTYLPYIGLFVIVGWAVEKLLAKQQQLALGLITVVGLVFTMLSYNQAGMWKNSATLWDNAIANTPSSNAYATRAQLLHGEGKSNEALDYYNKALDMNLVDHQAYCNRANIYFERNQDSLALADYNEALRLKPDFVGALSNRGALLTRAKKSEQALPDLNKAIELDPKYHLSYTYRAVALFDLKRYDEAARDFSTYLSFAPNAVDNRNSLGLCYKMTNRHEDAIREYTRCIAQDPKIQYYFNRSVSYSVLGKMAEARADAQKAIQGGMRISQEYLKSIGL